MSLLRPPLFNYNVFPYVSLRVVSFVVFQTACPAWNEHFTCDFNNVDREVLLLEVRDGHSNAVLGRSYIPLLGQ